MGTLIFYDDAVAAKRNRWLVISVLVVAIGAFLAISIIPIFAGRGDRPGAASAPGSTPEAIDPQAELEARARGYELVLEREPDNQTAIIGLVETRIQLGDLQGVLEPLKKLAELNPSVPEYQILLGQTHQSLGNLDEAAQAYRAVLTQQPGNMKALQGLVALLLEQDRPQAAVGLLQDTLQNAPQQNEVTPGAVDVVSVRLLLAEVYATQERFDDAIQLYDEAIADNTEDFRPLLAKALVLRDMGRTGEASRIFQQAGELAPPQYKDQVRQLAAGLDTAPAEGASTPDEDGGSASEDESAE